MEEIKSNTGFNNSDDMLNIQELFHVLLQQKYKIVFITAFVSLLGVFYSLSIPNTYQSKALLAPASSSSNITNALQNYAGIAGISTAGFGENEDNNPKKAVAKATSLSFFKDSIMPYIFLPDLMALESWNYRTNTLIYNEEIFDTNTNVWIGDASDPHSSTPTAQQGFAVFKQHLSVSESLKTGFVTISVKHQSPFIAKEWADLVVNQLNSYYRSKDKQESIKAVDYLNEKILTTNFSEIKQGITELLQDEIQKLSLIEASEFYVFEYIDYPAAMETKIGPNRPLICFISAILGLLISLTMVLAKHYSFFKKIT